MSARHRTAGIAPLVFISAIALASVSVRAEGAEVTVSKAYGIGEGRRLTSSFRCERRWRAPPFDFVAHEGAEPIDCVYELAVGHG